MEVVFFYLIGFAWIALGIYMMYSAVNKNKGVKLPSKNLYGIIFVFPKQGQEWYLFLIGLVWVVFWSTAFVAILLGY